MLRVAINGKFLAESMQGIVRYARELTSALDDVLDPDDYVEIIIPPNATDVPAYDHIRVVPWGHHTGIAWEQIDFARYLWRHRDLMPLNLCNVIPILGRPGVTTIHDIMYRVRPDFYTTLRNRLSRRWHCLQYRLATGRELAILTVSEYSRQELAWYYPKSAFKTHVVPCGWQHVRTFEEAPDWRDRYPDLMPGQYFFSLATLAKNKNGRWVYEVARRNPHLSFALAGRPYESADIEKPDNVKLLGYVSDADACALIKNSRAFIFPSLYEGFGLPPLEALSLGADVIASNTTSLPEVLGGSVHYIDPLDYEVNLDALLMEPVEPASEALDRYSWGESAAGLQDVFDADLAQIR